MSRKTIESELEKSFKEIALSVQDDLVKGNYIVEKVKVDVLPAGGIIVNTTTPLPFSMVEPGEQYCSIKMDNGNVSILAGKKDDSSPIPILFSTNCTVLFQQEENLDQDYSDKENENEGKKIFNMFNKDYKC